MLAKLCAHDSELPLPQLEALCLAAPLLRELHADAECDAGEEARRVLRCDAPLGPLRLRALRVLVHDAGEPGVRALTADLAAHAPPSLAALTLHDGNMSFPLDDCIDALVDMALARRLTALIFCDCDFTAQCVPAVCRLLRGSDALRTLDLDAYRSLVLDVPTGVQLAAALRANCTLTSLVIGGGALWGDPVAAAALLGALTAHPSLHTLIMNASDAREADAAVVSALLGALVAADAPALRVLDVSNTYCGDTTLGPLVDALAANTHLQSLDVSQSDFSDAFMRRRLLPVVRANQSLRVLNLDGNGDERRPMAWRVVMQMEALIASRSRENTRE